MDSFDPTRPPPYKIGLTGNIATGKSTVGQMLAALGAELIDADRLVHVALKPEGAAYRQVVSAFGPAILDRDGAIDRKKLGALVFDDPAALAKLEALVHPPVIEEVTRRIAASSAPVVVVEAIKLLESGMADSYDALWVTTCSEAHQLARLIHGRGLSRDEALKRIRMQAPQETKVARADVLIDTNGTMQETQQQVYAAWECYVRPNCQRPMAPLAE